MDSVHKNPVEIPNQGMRSPTRSRLNRQMRQCLIFSLIFYLFYCFKLIYAISYINNLLYNLTNYMMTSIIFFMYYRYESQFKTCLRPASNLLTEMVYFSKYNKIHYRLYSGTPGINSCIDSWILNPLPGSSDHQKHEKERVRGVK